MDDLLDLIEPCQAWLNRQSLTAAPMTLPPILPDRKWLYRSALQKAVRRGQTARAMAFAAALEALDERYLWRSLALLTVEDIGVANPDAVSFATALARKTIRGSVCAPDEARNGLVRALCESPKSQACCELSIAVDLGEPELIGRMAAMPDLQLLREVEGGDPRRVYAALGLVRGVFRDRAPRKHDIRAAAETVMLERLRGVPDLARAALQAFRRPVDSMSVAVLPAALMMLADQTRLEPDRFPPGAVIGGVPAEAFDMHTRTGKFALKAFHTSLSKSHRWLERVGAKSVSWAIGAAVFLEEGGLVDRRLTNALLTGLRGEQARAFLTAYGVPEDLHVATRALVADKLAVLNAKRRWAASLADGLVAPA